MTDSPNLPSYPVHNGRKMNKFINVNSNHALPNLVYSNEGITVEGNNSNNSNNICKNDSHSPSFRCGDIYCSSHSQNRLPLFTPKDPYNPTFYRVCDCCFFELTSQNLSPY